MSSTSLNGERVIKYDEVKSIINFYGHTLEINWIKFNSIVSKQLDCINSLAFLMKICIF